MDLGYTIDDKLLLNSSALAPPSAAAAPSSRRYSDKRRFTSRVAARERRSTESELLHDLGRSLPITQFALNSLDKISILRLAVANLKLRDLFGDTASSGNGSRTAAATGMGSQAIAIGRMTPAAVNVALDEVLHGGFLVVISTATGEVVYVSEGISECLGLTSYEVTGKSIYEFSHPSDRPDIERLFAPEASCLHRAALVRLKCNLFPSINPLHFRPVSNKVIHLSGKMYLRAPITPVQPQKATARVLGPCFVGIGRTIPHPADNGYPYPSLSSRMFTSLHSMKDLSFIRADESVEHLLRFNPTDLINLRGMDFVHGEDTNQVVPAVRAVYSKGQSQTGQYRFLCKGGGWVWIISENSMLYTSTYRANANCPASSAVFCRNFVISDIETDQILSLHQLPESKSTLQSGSSPQSQSQPPSSSSFTSTISESSCSSGSPAPSTPSGSGSSDDLMNMLPAGLFEEFLHSGSETESEYLETAPAPWMPDPQLKAVMPGVPVPVLKEEPFAYCDDDSLLRTLADDGLGMGAGVGVNLDDLSALPEFNEALDALLMKEEQPSPEEQAASLWSPSPSPQDVFPYSASGNSSTEQQQQYELKRRAGVGDGEGEEQDSGSQLGEIGSCVDPKYPRLGALLR